TFGLQDRPRGPEVIVVNRLFADSRFPSQDPIGQRVRIENGNRLVTVIGVVANGKYGSVDEAPMPIMYFDWRQHHRASMAIIVRTAGEPKTFGRAFRDAFAQIDPNMEVFILRTLQDDLDLNLLFPNLIVEALVGLGLLTLVLTTVGLYGTVFYSVAQRR